MRFRRYTAFDLPKSTPLSRDWSDKNKERSCSKAGQSLILTRGHESAEPCSRGLCGSFIGPRLV